MMRAPYQPLDLPTETSCSLTTLILLHASDIVHMHALIITAILVSLLSLLIPFLSLPHFLSPTPAIYVYKNTCWFCNYIDWIDKDIRKLMRRRNRLRKLVSRVKEGVIPTEIACKPCHGVSNGITNCCTGVRQPKVHMLKYIRVQET